MPDKYFYEISPETLKGSVVVLDVDGTLVPDQGTSLPERTRAALAHLAEVAEVHLCSNARPSERLAEFARLTGAQVVRSHYLKPSLRVLEGINASEGTPRVVIGDRYLTDGRLAARWDAQFLMVRRLQDRRERFLIRLLYVLDAILGPTVCFLERTLRT